MPTVDHLEDHIRLPLAERFLEQMVLGTYRDLSRWGHLTGQTAQLDSGYLGQHLVSLVSGEPGRGSGGRGKGDDLLGGAEVKVASTLGGVDTPRWNHLVGTTDADRHRNLGRLLAHPALYYVLLDSSRRGAEQPLRVRIWRVRPGTDPAFRQAARTWTDRANSRNLQLHPPCWSTSNDATLVGQRLRLPLLYEARESPIDAGAVTTTHWDPDPGRCLPVTPPLFELAPA